ncbi:septal ring lytic transglycosylase RlpA family protein [Stutzerimonas balearica]|jgi:rare lipoprotein A|uniref:Endolytic peptidoglycan transglycosylase RlpA n=1 Tax=Stutzerimonas balearica TaxID=74829 RepID=A0A9X7YRH1_9GAMM|nr:septal ring lytic transglycosylase RlpA family protein [Stutzerimonas balearica]KIL06206.1 lipoprotein [Stutzerimonas stutzeri]MBB63341.1 septal ring lytic transglycosylase RlpA family lipoprotein [Pseudomonas sp.]MBZ5757915.1 septal ring lytic transglycosylase RlpA family protein [Pseudomonas sp. S5(2021)]WIX02084.1 septal ring lytic transglycosylase RlpA family protein [Pseudomonas sp. AR5]MBC7199947.1 septal ring lytic transglycosylase RlpA family protein [Stutzerimonas balearica]
MFNGRLLTLLLFTLLAVGCAERPSAPAPDKQGQEQRQPFTQRGKASFYARMHHGQKTASGEAHDQQALVAAHRSLPFGTRVRVTNLDNGRQVVVRINDRGPYRRGRIIDLSRAAAAQLGMIEDGIAPVRLETLP